MMQAQDIEKKLKHKFRQYNGYLNAAGLGYVHSHGRSCIRFSLASMVTMSFLPLSMSATSASQSRLGDQEAWGSDYPESGQQRNARWCVGAAAGSPVICRSTTSMVQVTEEYAACFYDTVHRQAHGKASDWR